MYNKKAQPWTVGPRERKQSICFCQFALVKYPDNETNRDPAGFLVYHSKRKYNSSFHYSPIIYSDASLQTNDTNLELNNSTVTILTSNHQSIGSDFLKVKALYNVIFLLYSLSQLPIVPPSRYIESLWYLLRYPERLLSKRRFIRNAVICTICPWKTIFETAKRPPGTRTR